jgi:uncharacterized damage-inducible protein DinB
MKRIVVTLFSLTLALALFASPTFAQAAPAAAAPERPSTGPRAEFLRFMEDAESKFIKLAEKTPAEKFAWRPGEGVRSAGEIFLHVAGGNYSIMRRVGAQAPADFKPQGYDTSTTDKAKIIEALKASFEHVRKGALALSDADLEKSAPWFGNRQATYREILFYLANHQHEHLGQSIAYARMNGIVPPWTEEAQQRQQQAPPKKQP